MANSEMLRELAIRHAQPIMDSAIERRATTARRGNGQRVLAKASAQRFDACLWPAEGSRERSALGSPSGAGSVRADRLSAERRELARSTAPVRSRNANRL